MGVSGTKRPGAGDPTRNRVREPVDHCHSKATEVLVIERKTLYRKLKELSVEESSDTTQ